MRSGLASARSSPASSGRASPVSAVIDRSTGYHHSGMPALTGSMSICSTVADGGGATCAGTHGTSVSRISTTSASASTSAASPAHSG